MRNVLRPQNHPQILPKTPKVYNKRGQSATDFRISVELVDLWELGRALSGRKPEAMMAVFVEGGDAMQSILEEVKARPFEIAVVQGWPQAD